MSEKAARIEDLVRFLVTSLVDDPDQVTLLSEEENGHLNIVIEVAESDTGKIIGRSGRTIKSIRTLARAAAGDNPLLVEVDVKD
ncbi:MAG: KH domain-containing protein [Actinomycetia bacterium]|nr:KH domain-containing protein [Actinomycetes bacterium]